MWTLFSLKTLQTYGSIEHLLIEIWKASLQKQKIHWNDLLRAWLWMLYHVVGDFEPSLTRYCWNVIEILFFHIFYASHLLQRKHKDLVRLTSNLSSMEGHDTPITKFGDRNIPPQMFPPLCSSPGFPPRKFPPHAKYAVNANLFGLESPIVTRAMWATNRNNVRGEGGEVSPQGWKTLGDETSGGETQGWKPSGGKKALAP